MALIDLGSVAYERTQQEQAEISIQIGLPLCHYPGTEAARYRGLLLLAKIRRVQGDRSMARALVEMAWARRWPMEQIWRLRKVAVL